ncbi:flagellar hook-basal body complex protein FliE [Roseburia sp. 499]|uniref:flagellar hook-basal body complex protein FliE n=1 Tax=Roseburia sp. 499 TaxID=1261634 RepID=UPI0009518555|nr:flagellar hook-basal body complex protein FliE [Roseburia sp. 499]WVK71210.1 flagellar hook-basal body complex protein FliE [Roseburia sp. 499]
MDITSLTGIDSSYIKNAAIESQNLKTEDSSFSSVLQSAKDMLNETSELQNAAEEAEMQFMLGYATNTHDLQAAQEKADIALNYTIAVRDKMLEAYKEIMNMQI